MVRPYRLGKQKVTQEHFDDEVKRLLALGLKQNEIADRLKLERSTIYRAMQRLGAPVVNEAKQAGEYVRLSSDAFFSLPELSTWIQSLRSRKIKSWRLYINTLKRTCDELQIYPSMLDLAWSQKWLAAHSDESNESLREMKITLRQWLKFARKITDQELTLAGLDAKHYGIGKWRNVKMSAEQRNCLRNYLNDNNARESLFVFEFGLDTCSRASEIAAVKFSDFVRLPNGLIVVNIGTTKTEKAGQSFVTGYVRDQTYKLAEKIKDGDALVKNIQAVSAILREAYIHCGIAATSAYFEMHPLHALRHVGAQRYLEKTNWNRAAVAKLGHWLAEKTLEDHYGGIPDDIVMKLFEGASE